VRKLYTKDFFGELSILFHTKRSMTIQACGKVSCFQISTSLLTDILGTDYINIILNSICLDALNNTELIHILTFDDYFNKIYPLFKLKFNKANEIVIKKDSPYKDKKICIVVEGNLINVL